MDLVGLDLTAVATGYGVWATHFIAILAYQASLDAPYQLSLTLGFEPKQTYF